MLSPSGKSSILTLVLPWAVLDLRAHRNNVNAWAKKDPTLIRMLKLQKIPVDSNRMAYGDFKVMVDAS